MPDFTELRVPLINIYLMKQCCGYGLLPSQAFVSPYIYIYISPWGSWELTSSLVEEVSLDWPKSIHIISSIVHQAIVSGMGTQTVLFQSN